MIWNCKFKININGRKTAAFKHVRWLSAGGVNDWRIEPTWKQTFTTTRHLGIVNEIAGCLLVVHDKVLEMKPKSCSMKSSRTMEENLSKQSLVATVKVMIVKFSETVEWAVERTYPLVPSNHVNTSTSTFLRNTSDGLLSALIKSAVRVWTLVEAQQPRFPCNFLVYRFNSWLTSI